VFYWIDKKQREVDFVMDDRSGIRMAIEVKLGGVSRDVAGLRTLMNMTKIGGVVLSDNDLEKDDHLVVPASVFLSLV
jgi:predicted AAA+ superfamily ATPase